MMSKPNAPTSSRREFLATVGLSALGTALPGNAVAAEPTAAMPADPNRDLVPNRANLGTLFPDVQKLAEANEYAYSYLSGRFASFAAFQSAAREKLLEVLLYRPDPVDAASRGARAG